MKCLISITVNSSNQFFALKKTNHPFHLVKKKIRYGKALEDFLDGVQKIVIYLNVYFWERYITNDFIKILN